MPSTMNEFLDRALSEEFTSKTDPKVLSDKLYRLVFSNKVETMLQYLEGRWGLELDKLIKEMNKIKGQPKFGDMNSKALGSFIASLKKLDAKRDEFTKAFDDAQDEYGVSLFKNMKKR